MPLRAAILDRDGTLYDDVSGQLQPGVPEMVNRLQGIGIQVYVASNEARDPRIEKLLGLPADRFLYGTEFRQKGSKEFVQHVMSATSCQQNELIYLGDSENDMREAANMKVALFNADWSSPTQIYGIGVSTPEEFASDVERYFMKDLLWYCTLEGVDANDRPLSYRGLFDPDVCKNQGFTRILKNRVEDEVTGTHLIMHLLASIYLEGLHLRRQPNRSTGYRMPLWCLYPSHGGGVSPILSLFERFIARMFSMTFEAGLLQRHQSAPSSHQTRMKGSTQDISAQFSTVCVAQNDQLIRKIKGNTVFLVDDFSTGSNAMETGRNELLACGAALVIGITVGKYGTGYTSFTPSRSDLLPSKGGPAKVNLGDFTARREAPQFETGACDLIQ